ncbi:Serine/threonine-protein kinase Rio1 [Cryphonectria parasitica EP155]|uniref:Serine/threonine-protein kinase RIO1 n=1 Tax=Cryphonectria parasitica (strain ATCC 38755 / EP155) TaxID=660469 RepID=A0A9P5CSX9_CRYP1|nr:Serine/threonine-protein kinase Rio1 [Cryphonectria parasitica EP155]KAF3769743.1 Serine/threonine-protein kinase Rio1 [Cryphonectria parasitica EP155]
MATEPVTDALKEPQHIEPPPGEAENEDELDDIFEEDDDFDLDGPSYNRQTTSGPAGAKPAANTRASVDDQISALSKHAAKIRLDDVKQSQDRDKDKADRATSELVLDQRTRMILLQMINRGVVNEIHGAISTGKEANVYGAVLHPDDGSEPVQRAIKVYKTAILVFKDRERYITGEHRFKSGADKGNSRKMVKLWAEKEFRNLRRIYAAGIPCPEPVSLKLHVMVMSFLGDKKGWAYPRLRDTGVNSDEEWRDLYIQLLGIMRRLYQVCRLVHADLSEYNILYHDHRLYIIDVSQSVEHDHPRSLEFLRMDIKNVGDFFRRQGVDTLADRTIFNFITAPEGPVEEPEMKNSIEHLYEVRVAAGDDEQAQADVEVDNEVFRNQYIPQTLEQVYDIEVDGQKIGAGQGDSLVYRNLLADQVVLPKDGEAAADGAGDSDGSDDESDDGAALSDDDDDDDESDIGETDGRPRGKRFQDKDEKKQHKQAVKEAKREKRKEKMPKHLKKKMVSSTSRKKK